MDCRKVDELLEDYLANDLAPEERYVVEGHVSACASCRHEAAVARALVEGLRTLPRAEMSIEARGAAVCRLTTAGEPPSRDGGDWFFTLETAAGRVYAAYGPRGLTHISLENFDDRDFQRQFARRFGRWPQQVAEPPAHLQRALLAHLEGHSRSRPRLDLSHLAPFQEAVLRKTMEIPRGEVRPYGWVAKEIGHPKAVRAVGTALGHNPLMLVIPCHRVLGADGELRGFGHGLETKRRLLGLEGVDADALRQDIRQGRRYYGCRSTRVFCFPTCRHARRLVPSNLAPFPSTTAALAAGYRPCKVCRPA